MVLHVPSSFFWPFSLHAVGRPSFMPPWNWVRLLADPKFQISFAHPLYGSDP
jgi:hypothetical protein